MAAAELLQRLDVDVRAAQRVTDVDSEGVRTQSGEFFRGDLVVWAAGIMLAVSIRLTSGTLTTLTRP